MDLVVDANILFSVLIKSGKTEDLMFETDIHLFVPEFIFKEFEKYKELIKTKTNRNEQQLSKLIDVLKKRIITIPNEETEKFIKSARKISPDIKDADYFALALKQKCGIWSNDKELKKQSEIKIYSTSELMAEFGR